MMQLSWWDSREERCGYTVDAAELFVAYKLCRKSKRRKESALAFEVDYEENLVELMELDAISKLGFCGSKASIEGNFCGRIQGQGGASLADAQT
jgi:hypothetical protein